MVDRFRQSIINKAMGKPSAMDDDHAPLSPGLERIRSANGCTYRYQPRGYQGLPPKRTIENEWKMFPTHRAYINETE